MTKGVVPLVSVFHPFSLNALLQHGAEYLCGGFFFRALNTEETSVYRPEGVRTQCMVSKIHICFWSLHTLC